MKRLFALTLALLPALPASAQERIEHADGNTYLVTGEFRGPGQYCGGGFRLRLEAGERVLFLNPLIEYHRLRIDLDGRQVEAFVGRRTARGRPLRGNWLRESRLDGGVTYYVPAGRAFAEFQSPDFRGARADRWFLSRLNVRNEAEGGAACLEGRPQS